MSIKPIDYNVMLPKTQELSIAKHAENVKNKNIVDSGFRLQEKIINKNSQKVRSMEKNTNPRINDNNSSKNQENKKKKDNNAGEQETKEEKSSYIIGNNIDIRI